MLWLACLLAVRNQRILTAWDARQADDARRATAGLPPRTRRRRRKTLTSLAAAAQITPGRHPSRGRHQLLPDTENADVGGVPDADEKPGNSGGVVGEVPGSVGEVPD
jgi:hypothetical protein